MGGLLPTHVLFAEDRRAFEQSRFWFQDAVHYPEPFFPFDAMPGIVGSPGVVDGLARVVLDVEQLADIQDDEILVAPFTSTSWTPVFGRIAGAVTDTGGVMCHAAIVAREYGLPAVLGTGTATRRIAAGDRIRVDANNGIVTIIDRC